MATMTNPPHEMRVLHVLDSLAPGGLENGVVNVARRLHGQGFDIHAACLRFRGDFAERMPRPDQIAVMGKQDRFSWSCVRNLRRHIAATRADVLHTHNLGTLIYAALATFGGRTCPIAHGEHGQIQKHELTGKRLWQRRLIFRCCKRVHVVSASVRENLADLRIIGRDAIDVITNGVDCDRYCPPASKAPARVAAGFDADAFVIGIVGRLVALKRHAMLFEAFARIANEHPAARLLVVGDGGDDREEIISSMQQHSFASRILWAGHQNDLKPWYQAMDLLAAPSEIEGLSNAVLEAMAAGVPVLAHSACGNAEVVSDKTNGFLRDIDSAETLAAILREAIAAPSQLVTLGANARAEVRRRFSMESMVAGYARLYRESAGWDASQNSSSAPSSTR